jgi:hypothetical protein
MQCDVYFKNHVEVANKFYYSIYRTLQHLLFPEREEKPLSRERGRPTAGQRKKTLQAGSRGCNFQSYHICSWKNRIVIMQ